MNLTFGPRGMLMIDDARILFRNFSGAPTKYNKNGGVRDFSLVISGGEVNDGTSRRIVDANEMAQILMSDTNKHGAGWNVKIKPPRNEDEDPFIIMKVKVSYNGRGPGPRIHLKSGNSKPILLTEETVSCLDNIDIVKIDMDINPSDGVFEATGEPYRTAYLDGMEVEQRIDRFAARYADEDLPY